MHTLELHAGIINLNRHFYVKMCIKLNTTLKKYSVETMQLSFGDFSPFLQAFFFFKAALFVTCMGKFA